MSCPSSSTWPSTLASGKVSCMRFRHRSNVDLPHPDGPMMAVTNRSGSSTDTLCTAHDAPKYAFNRSTDSLGASVGSALGLAGVLTVTLGAGTGRGLESA